MQDLTDLIREYCDYYFTRVHTSMPGVISEYNAKTRRAIIQPSLERRAGNKEFVPLPLLIDVPVQFPGTKKYTIHFPLEKGDEVSIFFSERSIEAWKDAGQDGIKDTDPRRFSLSDAYCVPGLQPQEFIATEEPGLQIIHKDKFDGELISHVVIDDNHVEVKYKDSVIDMKKDVIEVTNGKCAVKINGDKASIKNKSKSVYKILDTLLDKMKTTKPTTLGSPAQHNWNPAIETAIGLAQNDLGMVMEE